MLWSAVDSASVVELKRQKKLYPQYVKNVSTIAKTTTTIFGILSPIFDGEIWEIGISDIIIFMFTFNATGIWQ